MVYIYVDESGDTGLSPKSRRFYTLAFVYCKDPDGLTSNLSCYWQYAQNVNIYPRCLNELKFNLPECKLKKNYSKDEIDCFKKTIPDIRSKTLQLINSYADGIFIALVDKCSIRRKTWTSERLYNYVFGTTLVENIIEA